MRSWNLAYGDPLCLTLSADTRLANPDYGDDQTWVISLSGSEPPSLALETSFGLRARRMRYYPRFLHNDSDSADPAIFERPPVVRFFYPNYCRLEYWPFPGIEVQADYWVPASNAVAGRLRLINHNILSEKITFEWVGLLSPIEIGAGLFTNRHEGRTFLQGKTSDLFLVSFCEQKCHPGKGPLPSLAVDFDLAPGNTSEVRWTTAACKEEAMGIEKALALLARRWDPLFARIILQNESQLLEISTGEDDLDVLLALTQATAFRLFFPGSLYLPHPTFVLSRQPDHGYSRRGDGSDYPFLWDGQTALDAYYLSNLILPGGADFAVGVLRNFLASQLEDGSIDWKPNLSGRPTRKLAQPLLASLAWQIYQSTEDKNLLQEAYPALNSFLDNWFSTRNDRDGDGIPEWDQPLQTGLEDNPLYDRWNPDGDGNVISDLESPGLASFLFREALCLQKIAAVLGQSADLSHYDQIMDSLRQQVESTWDATSGAYRYRDLQTHRSTAGAPLISFSGPGKQTTRMRFKAPQRLLFKVTRQGENTRAVTLRLTGQVAPGESLCEEISPRDWVWTRSTGWVTSQNIFISLSKIETTGMEMDDQVQVSQTNLMREDISLLFPLWAGIPDPERARVIAETLLPARFLKPYGIPDYLPDELHPISPSLIRATPLWNAFIGEGLLNYGFRTQAADLFQRLVESSLLALRSTQAFHQFYNPETGLPIGERNHLHGLLPLRLFLQVAGIQQIGTGFVILKDFNAFPFTVNVKYQGMEITCAQDLTTVVFPGGQSARVTTLGLHRVARSESA